MLIYYQQMSTDLVPKSSHFYNCIKCDYFTSRKSQFDRHISTLKHKKSDLSTNINEKVPKSSNAFQCDCGKQYKERSGLWRHQKNCKITITEKEINEKLDENNGLVNYLIKENQELKNLILDIAKKDTHIYNNTTTTNSHNKSFNLQFFLNETCKDAMNITDFVESIQLQLSDLERVGEVGYVEGISSIIIKNLKELDVTQRPIHCTDKKRETLYVKDEDKWEKDDENTKMHKMVKKVQDKNIRMIKKFKEKYPDYYKASSKHSDAYNNIIIESMGGRGDNDYEKEEKIIRKISNVTTINK
jgi:hypothetical protein